MSKQFSAIYPGSFDPVTNGHLDIIDRSRSKFDLVIVAVLVNLDKEPFFATEERVEMLINATEKWDNVEVDTFEGLLVNYAREKEAQVILRAIRAVTDYEYEFQMALMNRRMEPDVETIFMVPAEKYSYLSSRLVKEIALLGGDVSGLVPPAVKGSLKKKTGSV